MDMPQWITTLRRQAHHPQLTYSSYWWEEKYDLLIAHITELRAELKRTTGSSFLPLGQTQWNRNHALLNRQEPPQLPSEQAAATHSEEPS